MISVSHLYDCLSYFVQVPNWLAYGDRYADLTMHKALAAEENSAPTAGVSAVHQLLVEKVPFPNNARILDAGCGFGGTTFFLQKHFGGNAHGITLSKVQFKVALKESRRRNLTSQVTFSLQSYDEALSGTFDSIITIESLAHSANLAMTLRNLSQALIPGGIFVLIEDMATSGLNPQFTEEFALLNEHWGCVKLPAKPDFESVFGSLGYTTESQLNLTPRVKHRPPDVLKALIGKYKQRLSWMPFAAPKAILSAYLGGLALENLYANGQASYWMLVFRKN